MRSARRGNFVTYVFIYRFGVFSSNPSVFFSPLKDSFFGKWFVLSCRVWS